MSVNSAAEPKNVTLVPGIGDVDATPCCFWNGKADFPCSLHKPVGYLVWDFHLGCLIFSNARKQNVASSYHVYKPSY
jgi:hypothetical protein